MCVGATLLLFNLSEASDRSMTIFQPLIGTRHLNEHDGAVDSAYLNASYYHYMLDDVWDIER